MAVLVAFATIEGQTGKIARFIEETVRDLGVECQLFDTSDRQSEVNLNGFETVILAGSVHERRHPKDLEVYITANGRDLDARRTLLVSVSLSAAFPEGLEDAQDYADEMKMRTEFEPDAELLVAGAIRSGRYDYFATQVLRHIVLRGRNYDPAVQEHEFTDWERLASDVQSFVEGANPR